MILSKYYQKLQHFFRLTIFFNRPKTNCIT